METSSTIPMAVPLAQAQALVFEHGKIECSKKSWIVYQFLLDVAAASSPQVVEVVPPVSVPLPASGISTPSVIATPLRRICGSCHTYLSKKERTY